MQNNSPVTGFGLIAYDTQKIRSYTASISTNSNDRFLREANFKYEKMIKEENADEIQAVKTTSMYRVFKRAGVIV